MKDSIYGELPPLRCNYHLSPIYEEQPYIAMEQFGVDIKKESSPKYPCCPCSLSFCCGLRTKN